MGKEEFAESLGQVLLGKPINPISIDVITDWMNFFRYSNTFPISQSKGRKKDIIVLTKAVASLEEIQDFIAFSKGTSELPASNLLDEYCKQRNVNAFVGKSTLECVKQLEIPLTDKDRQLFGEVGDKKNLLKKALDSNLLSIFEHENSARISKEVPETIPESTFVVTDFSLDFQDFYEVLYKETKRAITSSYGYAWVYDIRREVCKKTHIHSSTFDEYLKLIYRKYGPDVMETAAALADTLAAKKIKEVPLNIDGRPIHRIRLKREHL